MHAVATDDELAAVLGHEIANVLANHSKNRLSVGTVASVVAFPFIIPTALCLLMEETLIFAIPFAIPLALVAASVFYVSRKREAEADYIGMMLMADAGFDPSAAVGVWKKMKRMEDRVLSANPEAQPDPQWLSTHPHVSCDSAFVADGP